MSNEGPPIARPQPRRLWTTSPGRSEPNSPLPESDYDENTDTSPLSPSLSLSGLRSPNNPFGAHRTRSVLNLTASTLAGIYAPDDDSSLFGVTPLHTGGATTPAGHFPPSPQPGYVSGPGIRNGIAESVSELDREKDRMAPVIGALERPAFRPTPTAITGPVSPLYIRVLRGIVRAALLFGLGALYGGLVSHLHDTRNLAPVKIEGLRRGTYSYTIFWGIAGILLGTALPIVDAIWEGEGPEEKRIREREEKMARDRGIGKRVGGAATPGGHSPLSEAIGLGAEWNPMVRSIGAFIGIGFAIRRLPWQSTLQASVTLGMVNPCLWYTIDRTVPGFALASAVGLLGTGVLLGTNVVPMPDVKSVPAGDGSHVLNEALPLGIEQGALAVWVWVASVLFCSCLCFGNIGRRLALGISGR